MAERQRAGRADVSPLHCLNIEVALALRVLEEADSEALQQDYPVEVWDAHYRQALHQSVPQAQQLASFGHACYTSFDSFCGFFPSLSHHFRPALLH